MRKLRLQVCLLAGIIALHTQLIAQLADWKPTAGTRFPTNNVWQINGMTRIVQMKFHVTDPNKMYAVTSEGGLFITTDRAENWTVAPGTEHMTGSCASICIDYTNDQTIWLGTGDPNYYSNGSGIKKSTDGGVTFQNTGLLNCLVVDIIQHPTNPNELTAATNKGVYRSVDGGATWTATLSTNLEFCHMISGEGALNTTLFATTVEMNPRLYRSADFGQTWTQITSGIVYATKYKTGGARIAVTPADPNYIIFEVIGGSGIIHQSTDGGLNFTKVKSEGSPFLTFYDDDAGSSGQGNYDNCITIDRNDPQTLWLQAHNTWKSEDGGATWVMLTHWASIVHTDMHQIGQSPHDAGSLYTCSDGGVWLSTDEGVSWTPKTDGIFAFEIANGAGIGSLSRSDFVSIGTQDNARLYGTNDGWFTISGGDDYAKRQSDYNGNIYYDGASRQENLMGNTNNYGLPTPNWNCFAFNHTDKDLAFMGYNDVYRCRNLSDNTTTWEEIGTFGKSIKAIHSCIADPNRLYAVNANQKLYICRNALDAVPVFETISLPFPSGAGTSITAMCNNADIVYITLGSRVYRSEDGGLNWTQISYNLPSVIHKRILTEEYGGTDELVFVGTNNAVYYKKKNDTLWTNYSTNLPSRRAPTEVTLFDDGTSKARIRYATYGRGMWETGFANLRAFEVALQADDSLITCEKPAIHFADASFGIVDSVTTYQWSFDGGTPATATTRDADVVYPTSGTYTVSLTINMNGKVQTLSKTMNITVQGCQPDTVPGMALQADINGVYATTPPIDMGTGSELTLMAWIKIEQTQNDFAGIIFSGNGGATGLNFRYNNQLGYHYNGDGNTWSFSNGPYVPMNTWAHVALVTTANDATLYLDGVPYVNNYPNPPLTFDQQFRLGNDRGFPDRTMHGQLDEVAIYNRALTTEEIRVQMHLTKNQTQVDTSLIAYYQFNETGTTVQDRVGTANATLNDDQAQVISTAPVGAGSCHCMDFEAPGINNWPEEGMSLIWNKTVMPSRKYCITKLNNFPDSMPVDRAQLPDKPGYYVIHVYEIYSPFPDPSGLWIYPVYSLDQQDERTPDRFKLFERFPGGYLASEWKLVDSAKQVSMFDQKVTFSVESYMTGNHQFLLYPEPCSDMNAGSNSLRIYPNPNNGQFVIYSNFGASMQLINELGQPVGSFEICPETSNYLDVSNLAAGMYILKTDAGGELIQQKIIIRY